VAWTPFNFTLSTILSRRSEGVSGAARSTLSSPGADPEERSVHLGLFYHLDFRLVGEVDIVVPAAYKDVLGRLDLRPAICSFARRNFAGFVMPATVTTEKG